ncbi:hypothetical protein FRC02_006710 [Tulasnella sp. 418]|nr:hypothetical protein FRC02_006710 [Tulasnella sp. 418]
MSSSNAQHQTQSEQPPPYQGPAQNENNLTVPRRPSLSDSQRLSMEDEARPLPVGWIRQFDHNTNHHFYVDTKASPPRSIWVHPLDDPEYRKAQGLPPLDGEKQHVSAFNDKHSHEDKAGASSKDKHKEERGFFAKMKDAAIGTKEEREAAKRERIQREIMMQKQYLERRRQILEAQNAMRTAYPSNPLFRNAGYGRPMYAPPSMAYGRRRGGGMGLPLAAGLGGGLLLGSMLDGDGYGGGDFGGGDFGGGDFGGGDF